MIFSKNKGQGTLEDSFLGLIYATTAVYLADCVEELGLGKLEFVHLFMLYQ